MSLFLTNTKKGLPERVDLAEGPFTLSLFHLESGNGMLHIVCQFGQMGRC